VGEAGGGRRLVGSTLCLPGQRQIEGRIPRLLAAMLLWVGAVLVGNGIWLIGQVRAAHAARQPAGAAGGGAAPGVAGRRPIELRSGPDGSCCRRT
jgi:hypothetical protein